MTNPTTPPLPTLIQAVANKLGWLRCDGSWLDTGELVGPWSWVMTQKARIAAELVSACERKGMRPGFADQAAWVERQSVDDPTYWYQCAQETYTPGDTTSRTEAIIRACAAALMETE